MLCREAGGERMRETRGTREEIRYGGYLMMRESGEGL